MKVSGKEFYLFKINKTLPFFREEAEAAGSSDDNERGSEGKEEAETEQAENEEEAKLGETLAKLKDDEDKEKKRY